MKKMVKLLLFSVIICMVLPLHSSAQVENVIVERYYVSDAADATDTTGGGLDSGSVTYRIYVDLKAGSRLIKLYGDAAHPLKFSSSENFFNNKADGQTFGKDFTKNRLQENTVALDSWITLGQTTRNAAKTYFGILKTQDTDGSFIGGVNNDGGSAAIQNGLMNNTDIRAGVPLTAADGMDTMVTLPSSWASYGFLDDITGVDSTIFGSEKAGKEFISYNAGLQNSGVTGVVPDSNQVLVAQLTTKGDLNFELNLVVEEPATPNPIQVKYVAHLVAGETNSDTLKLSPFLKYPQSCGCADPEFLEYSPAYACGISDSCHTRIKFGCMDTAACNYDRDANYNVVGLCCYPGYCNDREIALVCPALNLGKIKDTGFKLFPDPAGTELSVEFFTAEEKPVSYSVYNTIGELIYTGNPGIFSGVTVNSLDVSALPAGIYVFRITIGTESLIQKFVKQ